MIQVNVKYKDPESEDIEVVERKGIGHPDTLADALANEVSNAYSRYCLEHFGFVLHHNIDKFYIGAGHYKNNFNEVQKLSPIRVQVNGRMSDRLGDHLIDIKGIQESAIKNYLFRVIPNLTEEDLNIQANATQHTKGRNWFTPISKADVPDAMVPTANDTSFCTSSYPYSVTERLTIEIEKYFWHMVDGYPVQRFEDIGQDIKIMSIRNKNFIDVTLGVPTLSMKTSSMEDYQAKLKFHEDKLREKFTNFSPKHEISIRINPYQKLYMLGIGSCIECGEEGVVGRGNSIRGVISSYRTHTLESWAGKNPVYHTGRVFGFLTYYLSKRVFEKFNVKCSISTLTRCGDSLLPPYFMEISTDEKVDESQISEFVLEEIKALNYVEEILNFKPWNL